MAEDRPRERLTTEDLARALDELPIEHQSRVRDKLVQVVVEFDQREDPAPVLKFVQSLIATGRLHRNPAYRKSLADADEADRHPPFEEIDPAAVFGRLRAQRA